MHSTDVVAYTYQADTYCPGCILTMLAAKHGVTPDAVDVEGALEEFAELDGMDYNDPYSYDSDDFPKVVFADSANDADYDHCANFADPHFKEVCDQHIAHDPKDCARWRTS